MTERRIFAITGTPGTGKTTVSAELRTRGYTVIDIGVICKEKGLEKEIDESRNTYEIDIDDLQAEIDSLRFSDAIIFIEGHLSHYLDVDTIIVLRAEPNIIRIRLDSRGYSEAKVRENMEAEALDVILIESMDAERPVFEVDTSELNVSSIAEIIEELTNGVNDKYLPGNIDWSEELLRWC